MDLVETYAQNVIHNAVLASAISINVRLAWLTEYLFLSVIVPKTIGIPDRWLGASYVTEIVINVKDQITMIVWTVYLLLYTMLLHQLAVAR